MAVSVTCTAPVNIAVVKYWGKRDEDLILPVNSSLSVTLGQDELRAKTTVAISKNFTEDRMWLNGKEQSVSAKRIQNVLREIRRRAKKRKLGEDGDKEEWKVHICSENNFPTAAGLASSAAGFACLVYTLAQVYGVEGDLSEIARQGSGSACRSVYGGFVQWEMGSLEDGSDSLASPIAPASHWPQLRILILVVSDQKKHVGSTEGMQTSVATSELMQRRIEVVPQHMAAMTQAVLQRDFPKFAEITMKESNQFHAVCLDTYPPISYLTDVSRAIIRLVHCFNQREGQTKLAYTFDAGPNACLYMLEEDVPRVVSLVQHFFPPEAKESFVRGLPVSLPAVSEMDTKGIPLEPWPQAIKYAIHTKTGEGPQVLDAGESLLDENGMPR